MHKSFDTPGPTKLYVELGAGDLNIHATGTSQTVVDIDGQGADDVIVEQRGDQVVVAAPHRRAGLFGTSIELNVHVTLPIDSEVATKLGSADFVGTGRFGTAKIRSGSGDVRLDELGGDAMIESGSGEIKVGTAAAKLRIKCGSGDVEIDRLDSATSISTGSGDVELGTTQAEVLVKSGSGSMRVKDAHTDVSLSTASGDLHVGVMHRGVLMAKNVSGDIRVGIPANIPVWTDIHCATGRVRSNLESAGQPEKGQDFIEVRAKTVSGNIDLEQM